MKKDKKISGDTDFGERLHYLREKAGLSQKDLAEKLGFKRNSSVSNLEAGKAPPDLWVFQKIAVLFNANLHWLITGKPSPDGESWRSSYAELLRIYHIDAGEWLDRLETEVKDWQKKKMQLSDLQGQGEPINLAELDRCEQEIAVRANKIVRIREHFDFAFARSEGIRIER